VTESEKLQKWHENWQLYWRNQGPAADEPGAGRASEGADWEEELLASVRTPSKDKQRLHRIVREFSNGFDQLHSLGPAVTVFGSARFTEESPNYKVGMEVGRELARAGLAVITGGGPGLMEAANRGAHEGGGVSIGCNLILPGEQATNQYVDSVIPFHYYFVRKVMLLKYSCAFVYLPGGFGTLDELFEAARLIQCGKIGPFPLMLLGSAFWRNVMEVMYDLLREGAVSPEDTGFGYVTDSPAEAVAMILENLPPAVSSRLSPPGRTAAQAETMG
jgi:uncharacterized protein (TIGR00730 family)